MKIKNIDILWLGHDGFLIENNKKIYIDPYKISDGLPKADILLITHSHYDHCSLDDIKKVISPETIVIAPPDCQSNIARFKVKQLIPLTPYKSVDIEGIKIEGFPAYNTNKPFHPKENEWLGYIINIDNTRIYHAGDTDFIPEMRELKNIDIALLPISGVYVMDPREAAMAVKVINPEIVIPMHYGSIVGGNKEKQEFMELVKDKVVIPDKL